MSSNLSGYSELAIKEVQASLEDSETAYQLIDVDKAEGSFASFRFIGKYKDKEVAFDAFLYPLEIEFLSGVYDDARVAVLESFPQYADSDFEEGEGEHIAMMEEYAREFSKDEAYWISEFIDFDEENEFGIGLDVCLNIESITEKDVTDFVYNFTSGKLKLDPTFYGFEITAD